MAIQKIISKKKQKIEQIVLILMVVFIGFFLYKNFFKKEVVYKEKKETGIAVFQDVNLYPTFSVNIQDVLEAIKSINLEIFSHPIKESGPTGNPNPFLPFIEEADLSTPIINNQ